MEKIVNELFEMQDLKYRDFNSKLIPEIDKEKIIGVRTPNLRAYAKKVAKEPYAKDFLEELPHKYYEENNLHGELLALIYKKDIEECFCNLEKFFPYVDNWATCDLMSFKIFKKNLPLVYKKIKKWVKSDKTYTVRFGIVTLMNYFLEEEFKEEMLKLILNIKSEDYYINMARAWYFSMALVKQYDISLKYFEKPSMDVWTHNKSIQKAVESRRISDENKKYLKTLKIR